MPFRNVFIAVLVAAVLIITALLIHTRRPAVERNQPTPDLVRASGKCASCHRRETEAIVVEFEHSKHAAQGVNCLDCHQVREGQTELEHRGFTLTTRVTSNNCRQCHATEYDQFLRSRHAAPAFAAVLGRAPFTPEQIAFAEQYHKGAVDRDPNALVALEGPAATNRGCISCHAIGQPNEDGTIGSCTQCHSRHQTSIALARQPETCGQCHMGPDHSQLEIYNESKHGVMFRAQKAMMNMDVAPENLTVADMPVPTCATCHMSGLNNLKVSHDVTERLSWWLFAPISEKRPTYAQGQINMKEVCMQCHSARHTNTYFEEAEAVLQATNQKVSEGLKIMDGLYQGGHLTRTQFDEPVEFLAFDFWHYYGRTAKHGAFMGGADFVQWHGNYELLLHLVELRTAANELMAGHAAQ